MTYTLLFDLDDTLLDTNIESFVPAFFEALSEHMAPHVYPNITLPALLSATRLAMDSEDPSCTLQEVFEGDLYSKIGIAKQELIEVIENFYDNVFPNLRTTTNPLPDAVPLIEWAISQGYRIAIATDPLFPRKATRHRLRWAGLDPEQFELISTAENFHFSKTHLAYYAEVIGQLGWPDGPMLMVGNDMRRDIIPADMLGLSTYFIDNDSASSPGIEAGRGKLADLRPWLESTDPSALIPSFKSPDAILAVMSSTPAVLRSMSSSLTEEQWHHEPTSNDWAINEIICHLRDSELEIHKVQLQLMIEKVGAFIPRPDSSVWANERNYLDVNGLVALAEFTKARMQNIEAIRNLETSIWSRKARHAIFGPTNFVEVVGFIADHDRAHVQQVWKTLSAIRAERV